MKFEDIKKLPADLQGVIFTLDQVGEENSKQITDAHERIDRFKEQVTVLTEIVKFLLKRLSEPDDVDGTTTKKLGADSAGAGTTPT